MKRPKNRWSVAGTEPSIEDLLADPVTHAVMKRDQLAPEAVRCVVDSARKRLSGNQSPWARPANSRSRTTTTTTVGDGAVDEAEKLRPQRRCGAAGA